MNNISCVNCGGIVAVDASGLSATCQFCGSRFLLNHEDTDYYNRLYAQMNAFFAAPKSDQVRKQQAELFWEKAKIRTFTQEDGTPIEIRYMHHYIDRDTDVYVARRNVVFHFINNGIEKTEALRRAVSMLDYPSADTRNLQDFFPKISGGFTLDDGSYLCVISKNEDEYPLRLFGKLHGRHAAWIISRLENLCCVLEFSSLVHPRITPDSVYINPYTHQACLYGDWWCAGKPNSLTSDGRERLQRRDNLLGLRNTAAAVLGYSDRMQIMPNEDIPYALAVFLKSDPCVTAYDDFALWDETLLKAYGERKFIKMDVDDQDIYNTRR